MYSPHKHSYLQSRSSGVKPRVINRSVNLAREQPTIDTADLEPPFLRLLSEQPNIPIKNVDVTRRPVAFGRWALPKLRKELHSIHETTVIQAINSIMDLVHDPEKGYEAIVLKIPLRMIDLLRSVSKEVRECICMALTVLAGLADGAEMLVKNTTFLENLAAVIEDPIPAVRMKAAALLSMLTRSWMGVYELVTTAFVPVLLDNLLNEEEEIIAVHLKSLERLLQAEGKVVALKYGAFQIFEELLDRTDPKILSGAANCISFLAIMQDGKEVAFNADVLVKLNRLLHDERPEVYSAAASAIMYTTLITKAKFRAKNIPHLLSRLLHLTKGAEESQARIHSIKALTNICEHPYIRRQMLEKHLEEVKSIPVHKIPEMEEYKRILLENIFWKPEKLV